MTKNEMTALLGSAGVTQEIITAMEQAYEMGFEQGANVAEVMKKLVEEAESVCNSIDSAEPSVFPDTARFWALFAQLRAMQ
jgi:flagellar biosynthesis/type III secretory pathway protein FliH